MTTISTVLGDITTQDVDAIVNAANTKMRGGGGVDGAIHRAAGPALLKECKTRFPRGLATGDAGWTTGADLPAKYVIHTPGPNYVAGQTDRALLESSYRRCLEIADKLGVRSIAFPLISAGAFGWPLSDAANIAAQILTTTPTKVAEIRIITPDGAIQRTIDSYLAKKTPLRLLQAVRVLHERGYHGVRVLPGMSGSGIWWRIAIAPANSFPDNPQQPILLPGSASVNYSTAARTQVGQGQVTALTSAAEAADLLLAELPELATKQKDEEYVIWFQALLAVCEGVSGLPIAYADWYTAPAGWVISGTQIVFPYPPN